MVAGRSVGVEGPSQTVHRLRDVGSGLGLHECLAPRRRLRRDVVPERDLEVDVPFERLRELVDAEGLEGEGIVHRVIDLLARDVNEVGEDPLTFADENGNFICVVAKYLTKDGN